MGIEASETGGLLSLLLSAAVISLSGVMMPGPVFAVTVAKGRRSPSAGAWIAVGHGVVEFPVMLLIYAGVAHFFTFRAVQLGMGIVGGAVLVWMGYSMIRSPSDDATGTESGQSPLLSGVLTTLANPYFFLWWVTVGSLLISQSLRFGFAGFAALAAVHWLCDFVWDTLVSSLTYRSRRLWTPLVHRVVFTLCGLTLIGFGAYFAFSVLA